MSARVGDRIRKSTRIKYGKRPGCWVGPPVRRPRHRPLKDLGERRLFGVLSCAEGHFHTLSKCFNFNPEIPAVLNSDRERPQRLPYHIGCSPLSFGALYDSSGGAPRRGAMRKEPPRNGGGIRKMVDPKGRRSTYLTASMTLLLLLVVAPVFLTRASALATSYSFNLLGPNTAMVPEGAPALAGDTLIVTGSGAFDTSTTAINGGGSYQIVTSSGMIVDKGTYII